MSTGSEEDSWWPAIEKEVAPKNLSLRCQDIVFRMTQSLASKDYNAVLYALTVLHTISINVSPDMRRTLINPTLNAKFEEVANGRSNTLAAGLTQLLHDWEYLFGNEDLGRAYAGILAHLRRTGRAAPGCKVSDAAKAYKANPTTNNIICRSEPLRGFNFARFNQRARFAPARRTGSSGAKEPRANAARVSGGQHPSGLGPVAPAGQEARGPSAQHDARVGSGGYEQPGVPEAERARSGIKPAMRAEEFAGTLNPRENTVSMPAGFVPGNAAPAKPVPGTINPRNGPTGPVLEPLRGQQQQQQQPARNEDIYMRITPEAAVPARGPVLGGTINEPEVLAGSFKYPATHSGPSIPERDSVSGRRSQEHERMAPQQDRLTAPHVAAQDSALQHGSSPGSQYGRNSGQHDAFDVRQVKVSRDTPLPMPGDTSVTPSARGVRESREVAAGGKKPILSTTIQGTINEPDVSQPGSKSLTPNERRALQQHGADMHGMYPSLHDPSSGQGSGPAVSQPVHSAPRSGGSASDVHAMGSLHHSGPRSSASGGAGGVSARSVHDRNLEVHRSGEGRVSAGSSARSSQGGDQSLPREAGLPGALRGSASGKHVEGNAVRSVVEGALEPSASTASHSARRQPLLSNTIQATENAPDIQRNTARASPDAGRAPDGSRLTPDIVAHSGTSSAQPDPSAGAPAAAPFSAPPLEGSNSLEPDTQPPTEGALDRQKSSAQSAASASMRSAPTNGAAKSIDVDSLLRKSCEKADSLTFLCRQIRSARKDGRTRDEVLRKSAATKASVEVEHAQEEVTRALSIATPGGNAAQLEMVAGECAAALQEWHSLASASDGSGASRGPSEGSKLLAAGEQPMDARNGTSPASRVPTETLNASSTPPQHRVPVPRGLPLPLSSTGTAPNSGRPVVAGSTGTSAVGTTATSGTSGSLPLPTFLEDSNKFPSGASVTPSPIAEEPHREHTHVLGGAESAALTDASGTNPLPTPSREQLRSRVGMSGQADDVAATRSGPARGTGLRSSMDPDPTVPSVADHSGLMRTKSGTGPAATRPATALSIPQEISESLDTTEQLPQYPTQHLSDRDASITSSQGTATRYPQKSRTPPATYEPLARVPEALSHRVSDGISAAAGGSVMSEYNPPDAVAHASTIRSDKSSASRAAQRGSAAPPEHARDKSLPKQVCAEPGPLYRTVSAPSDLSAKECAVELVAFQMALRQPALRMSDPRYISQLVRAAVNKQASRTSNVL